MDKPKATIAWGWYNYGTLIGVEGRRRDAIAAIESHVGAPWKTAREYMQVRKVKVTPLEERDEQLAQEVRNDNA